MMEVPPPLSVFSKISIINSLRWMGSRKILIIKYLRYQILDNKRIIPS
jgi:hypothetical protein